jgi:deoxyribonucleoside regulator
VHKFEQMNQVHLDLLAQVATWYYEDGLDQETIGQRINRSRSMVSRLLDEARRAGLVEIRVRYPLKTDPERERQLCSAFEMADAIVLAQPPSDYNLLLRRLGELGARYLEPYLHPNVIIGVGSGTGVYSIVRGMPTHPVPGAIVVQFVGAIGHGDPMVDGAELARWLAEKLGAGYRHLSAPLIVESEEIAQGLIRDRAIAEALALGARADVALVGVGSVLPDLSSLSRAGYVTPDELAEIARAGSVGDIMARQIDAQGRPLDLPIDRRVIGLPSLDMLHRVPRVMAVAAGPRKVPAIIAALRGRYLKVLVTDANTADAVLQRLKDGA